MQRILGAFIGLALFVAAFVFASVVLAVAAAAALVLWGWLCWRTRDLPKAAAERRAGAGAGQGTVVDGEVIEGEVTRTEVRIEGRTRRPPGDTPPGGGASGRW